MSLSWKKMAVVGLAALGLLAALAWVRRADLAWFMVQRQVATLTADADPLAALPDGLHVGLCGAGSPFPDPKRSGPCTVVVAGRRMLVFDAGSGAARNLGKMRLNAGQIEALFLTHFHSDHIDGLGELMLQRWGQGAARQPLPVYGPAGLERVLGGFEQAYAADRGWRIAHHGEAVMPASGAGTQARPFDVGVPGARQVLIRTPELEVVAFAVEHAPVEPSVGYRIRYKDRVLVLSGDTRPSQAVLREAQGADLLVHEALSPELLKLLESGFDAAGRRNLAAIMHDVHDYHTTPEQAADLARQAGVRKLVFNHIVPPVPTPLLNAAFLQRAEDIFGAPIRIGEDGDWFSLPAGTTDIQQGRRP